MVQRGRETVAQTIATFNYRSNTTVGNLNKPFELRFATQKVVTNVYPNPFRTTTNIDISLSGSQNVNRHLIQVSIVDVSGRVMLTKTSEEVSGASHRITWNGKKSDGSDCGNGLYFIKVIVDNVPKIYTVMKQ